MSQYDMEPNEFADARAVGELIIKIASNDADVSQYDANPGKISKHFFITMLILFMFFSLSAHATTFFTRELEIFGMFINDLYCIRTNEDLDDIGNEDQDQDQDKDDPKPIQRYEEKYVDALAKMENKELTPEYVEGLMNNFVMESTPSGNVMMRYNSVKESFEYYSDSIIPNRFLDVVARKFVTMYDCASLYDVEKAESVVNAPTVNVAQELKDPKENKPTSSVFAKFKTYNNGASNKASMSSSSSSQSTVVKKNLPLKEVISSNRYTSCGKMANMMMLKKVDRKIVDKTYGMSFSEFKQLKSL